MLAEFIRVGFTRFAGYLAGGMEEWDNLGPPLETGDPMAVQQLKAALPSKGLQVVDVRTPREWDGGRVPDARYVFLPELAKKLDTLKKDEPVVVYCDSGYRAKPGGQHPARPRLHE